MTGTLTEPKNGDALALKAKNAIKEDLAFGIVWGRTDALTVSTPRTRALELDPYYLHLLPCGNVRCNCPAGKMGRVCYHILSLAVDYDNGPDAFAALTRTANTYTNPPTPSTNAFPQHVARVMERRRLEAMTPESVAPDFIESLNANGWPEYTDYDDFAAEFAHMEAGKI